MMAGGGTEGPRGAVGDINREGITMSETRGQPYPCVVLWIAWGALLVGVLSGGPLAYTAELYRWVDAQGRVSISDTPPPSSRDPQPFNVSRPAATAPPSEPTDTRGGTDRETPPPTTPGGIVVQAELNRRLTAPLRLDMGAEVTVLTTSVAKALAMASLEHMPRHAFKTGDGMVTMPITSLRSLRVGSAEARDVTVAIDLDGRMPVGLLGMSFLRRFKVTIDQEHGQVTFER
jgi:clan AA aspartic protease (TIGR02281 family)